MVSYSEGSINSLLYKLTSLKIHPPGIEDLKQDLVSLKDKFFPQGCQATGDGLQV